MRPIYALNNIPIKFLLEFRNRLISLSLSLIQQLSVPLTPLLLHHLLPPFILQLLLLFLLLPPLFLLLLLKVLLLPAIAAVLSITITVLFVFFFVQQLHLVDQGVRADRVDQLLNLSDHAQHVALPLPLLTGTQHFLVPEYLQILLAST